MTSELEFPSFVELDREVTHETLFDSYAVSNQMAKQLPQNADRRTLERGVSVVMSSLKATNSPASGGKRNNPTQDRVASAFADIAEKSGLSFTRSMSGSSGSLSGGASFESAKE